MNTNGFKPHAHTFDSQWLSLVFYLSFPSHFFIFIWRPSDHLLSNLRYRLFYIYLIMWKDCLQGVNVFYCRTYFQKRRGIQELQTLWFLLPPSPRSSANVELMLYIPCLRFLPQNYFNNNIAWITSDTSRWTFLIFLLNPGIKVDLSTLKDKVGGGQLLKIICISFIWWPNLLPTLLSFCKLF